ncbi:rRNA maturation RNase YbeY [Candidatus Marinamargulisbacteria bacterium SCGC AG-439-L15]|nr:rRNA maturation RNase YbeY [Candidatus Marinamargulisbacteria bacterium SCGC AG-439-L15]
MSEEDPIKVILSNNSPIEGTFNPTSFIKKVLKLKNITTGTFEFAFVSPEQIQSLNKAYLNKDEPTDIISFNLGTPNNIIGDVYICIEKAKENAKYYNSTLEKELRLLLVHGILHLLDYKDYTEKEKQIMRAEESRLLTLLEET